MLERLMTAGRPVRFLASVKSVAEAKICVANGADVIDCKDPSRGALGALDHATVEAIRAAVPPRIPVSATIGDQPSDPETVAHAVTEMAATGADFVKIGCFPEGDPFAMIARVGELDLRGVRLVGVIFVDLARDATTLEAPVAATARAGFAGVMLDTANKAGARLPEILTASEIDRLVGAARRAGLFVGLAGSLRLADIAELRERRPDVLGFRGALCRNLERGETIDPAAVVRIAAALAQGGAKSRAAPRLATTEL